MSSTVTFHVGDVRDRMAAMPDSSVDLIVTSPPFLALRSYLPADHPDKHREIGSEPTPAAFLDTLLELTAEWRRILTPTGSLCVELGDTYSGSSNDGGPQGPGISGDGGARWRDRLADDINEQPRRGPGWPLAKSLCAIPALYQTALAYGINPLTGQPSPAGQWRCRNQLVWTRPNPPVGALGDKWRPATSYVTVAATSDKRWFDLDAVRHENPRSDETSNSYRMVSGKPTYVDNGGAPAGAPPLDWHHDEDWQPLHRLPTAPYPGAHYATYPLALPRKLIEAMCPRQVCTVCGEARRRITKPTDEYATFRAAKNGLGITEAGSKCQSGQNGGGWSNLDDKAARGDKFVTLGWSDCGCDIPGEEVGPGSENQIATGLRQRGTAVPPPSSSEWTDCNWRGCDWHPDSRRWRPGLVLDPFAGSGTTLLAAALLGRNATGIDIDNRNRDLTEQRLRDAAHVTGDNPWTVNPDLPGLKHQHPDQQSLFTETT